MTGKNAALPHGWICSRCGGDQVIVNAARPSIDPRYALGLCSRCSKDPDQPGALDPAKVQQLIARQAYNPKVLEARRRERLERRIARNPRDGEHEERARILEWYRAEARERETPA